MVFKALFYLHLFITAILGISTVATLLGLASGPDLKPKELTAAVLIFLFFSGTGYWAWRLKEQGNSSDATLLLAIMWVLLIFGVIYAAGKARWN